MFNAIINICSHFEAIHILFAGSYVLTEEISHVYISGHAAVPIVFNIDTKEPTNTRRYKTRCIRITAQEGTLEEVEPRLENALNVMSVYYEETSLNPNPPLAKLCQAEFERLNSQQPPG